MKPYWESQATCNFHSDLLSHGISLVEEAHWCYYRCLSYNCGLGRTEHTEISLVLLGGVLFEGEINDLTVG